MMTMHELFYWYTINYGTQDVYISGIDRNERLLRSLGGNHEVTFSMHWRESDENFDDPIMYIEGIKLDMFDMPGTVYELLLGVYRGIFPVLTKDDT